MNFVGLCFSMKIFITLRLLISIPTFIYIFIFIEILKIYKYKVLVCRFIGGKLLNFECSLLGLKIFLKQLNGCSISTYYN